MQTSQKKIFRQFLKVLDLIRPFWSRLFLVMLSAVVIQFLTMLVPYCSQLLIDKAYPRRDYGLMELLVAAIIVVNLFSILMRHSRAYFNVRISAELNNTISLLFFNHIQHLPSRFFDQRRTGEIVSRFQDISNSIRTVTNTLQVLVMHGIYLFLVPPILIFINHRLAWMTLFTIPFMFLITYRLGHASRPYLSATAINYAELRGFQTEVLQNIRSFKAMALEHYAYQVAKNHMLKAMAVQLKASRIGSIYGAANGIVRTVSTALYTWFGWKMILSGQITLGQFIALTSYAGYLYQPISELVSTYSDFQQTSVSFDRMFEYLDETPEQDPAINDPLDSVVKVVLSGDIQIRNVIFGYAPGVPILRSVNVVFKKGSVNVIVGPSGSGKTSLLRLLLALDRPESGQILIDGNDVSQLRLSDLRRQIAVVWQDSGLIKGTVRENLLLGAPQASDEWMRKVARICCLDQLVESLPLKYETPVSEKGATLSAGQCQRLAIGRALMKRSPILMLDEATANVDMETEMKVLRQIIAEFRETTIILVSHRPSTTALADKVFMMQSGEMIEAGAPANFLPVNNGHPSGNDLPVDNARNEMGASKTPVASA